MRRVAAEEESPLSPSRLLGDPDASARVLNLADVKRHPGWSGARLSQRTGLGAYLGVAVQRGGQGVGLIEVMREASEPFTRADELLLDTVGLCAAAALAHDEWCSDAALTRALDAVPLGVIVLDALGHPSAANPAMRTILGRALDPGRPVTEQVGDFVFTTVGEEQPRTPGGRLLHRVLEGQEIHGEHILVSTSGSPQRRIELTAVPLRGPAGRITGVLGIAIDLTREHELLSRVAALEQEITYLRGALAEREHRLEDLLVRVARHEPAATGPEYGELLGSLTVREREVLGLLAEGRSNQAIGAHLGLASNTVKLHVRRILRKLGVNSRVQAALVGTAIWPARPSAGAAVSEKPSHRAGNQDAPSVR